MKKRTIALFLTCAISLMFVGCNNTSEGANENQNTNKENVVNSEAKDSISAYVGNNIFEDNRPAAFFPIHWGVRRIFFYKENE